MPSGRHSLLDVKCAAGVTVVKIVRPELIDDEEIDVLADYLFSQVAKASPNYLVLDFHDVKLMATSTWGILLRLLKMVTEGDGRLALCGFHPYLHETIQTLRLNQVFSIYDCEESALSSFQS